MRWLNPLTILVLVGGLAGLLVLNRFTPPWFVGLLGLIGGLVWGRKPGAALLSGLVGGGLAWGIAGLTVLLTTGTAFIDGMGQVMGLGNAWVLLAITAVLGALSAGLGAVLGTLVGTQLGRLAAEEHDH